MSDYDFLLGLIAGEGSFMLTVSPVERRRWNVAIKPQFTIHMYELDVLEKSKELCNDIGTIDSHSDGYSWKVRSVEDCRIITDIVDNNSTDMFESTNKYEQFTKWKKGLHIIESEKHLTKEGTIELVDISFDIGKSSHRKLSKEDILSEIEKAGDYYCGGENNDGSTCQRHVSKPDNTCQHH